jgi:hypothetical protein
MVLPTYLPTLFFPCALFGKFYVQSALFLKKIPCPFSVLDKTLYTDIPKIIFQGHNFLVQWNLSNLTHQGPRVMCWIVQDVNTQVLH